MAVAKTILTEKEITNLEVELTEAPKEVEAKFKVEEVPKDLYQRLNNKPMYQDSKPLISLNHWVSLRLLLNNSNMLQ